MIGASPSGKAVGSGPTIRGFESLRSSQSVKIRPSGGLFFFEKRAPDSTHTGCVEIGGLILSVYNFIPSICQMWVSDFFSVAERHK